MQHTSQILDSYNRSINKHSFTFSSKIYHKYQFFGHYQSVQISERPLSGTKEAKNIKGGHKKSLPSDGGGVIKTHHPQIKDVAIMHGQFLLKYVFFQLCGKYLFFIGANHWIFGGR